VYGYCFAMFVFEQIYRTVPRRMILCTWLMTRFGLLLSVSAFGCVLYVFPKWFECLNHCLENDFEPMARCATQRKHNYNPKSESHRGHNAWYHCFENWYSHLWCWGLDVSCAHVRLVFIKLINAKILIIILYNVWCVIVLYYCYYYYK